MVGAARHQPNSTSQSHSSTTKAGQSHNQNFGSTTEANQKYEKFECLELLLGRSRESDKACTFDVLFEASVQSRATISFDLGDRQEIKMQYRHLYGNGTHEIISLTMYIAEVVGKLKVDRASGYITITFRSKTPLRIFKRSTRGFPKAVTMSQDTGHAEHNGRPPMWVRCNEIGQDATPEGLTTGPIYLYQERSTAEVGRCNTYKAVTRSSALNELRLQKVIARFAEFNVECCKSVLPLIQKRINLENYKTSWFRFYQQKSLGFEARYLLEAAVSTNCIDEAHLDTILFFLTRHCPAPEMLEKVLQQIVFAGKHLTEPIKSIQGLFDCGPLVPAVADVVPEYCVRLHKVLITSTTMIICPPALEVSNRILRQYSAHIDRFLRVQFLDEVGRGKLHGGAPIMTGLFDRVKRTLIYGIHVGGRVYRFLAFGNSQLREHGIFFFSDCVGEAMCGNPGCTGLSASKIREDIGDVSKILIVAKQAARVGQAFSTTRAMQKARNESSIVRIPDNIESRDNLFCFSDGVGMVTKDILIQVAHDMGHIGDPAAAFQFRLGGAKGVLALANPSGITIGKTRHLLRPSQIFLRPSQIKFESDHDSLEIVRLAKYGSSFLNRQFITTLWSLGVDKEVFLRLQRAMIHELDMGMTDEVIALKCLRKHVDEHGSSVFLGELVSFGFMSRGDPFVYEVLRLFRSWSLKMLKEKARVSVDKGCFLMGVVDETKSLRGHYDTMYDQNDSDLDRMDLPEIFITDAEDPASYKVIEQICVIGRAPALHPGDLRVVRAVDKPELRYLYNVLVMPAVGDQDVSSMCSGGDLDGDDYTIFWDPNLIPPAGHRYQRPMDHVGAPPKLVQKITLRDIFDFIIDFMKNDSLGQIAFAHLAFAHDSVAARHGRPGQRDCRAFSDTCIKLADLHSIAVDFPKTGIAAVMPMELRRTSFPDFMQVPRKPSFISDTPLSLMFREINANVIDYRPAVKYDKTLCDVPNMIEHISAARELKRRYDESVRRLMTQYGIKSEVEVVTGFILSYDSQFAGHQREYSMRVDVAQQYGVIRDSVRAEIQQLCSRNEAGEMVDVHLTEQNKEAFVAAMYDVTFSDMLQDEHVPGEIEAGSPPAMSFPWVEHDVLGRLSARRNERAHGSRMASK